MLYDATVLLATYNGENFLDEQLKSIASQVGVKVSVYVVDAGSSDQTISILQKWFNRGLKLSYRISEGSNPKHLIYGLTARETKRLFHLLC